MGPAMLGNVHFPEHADRQQLHPPGTVGVVGSGSLINDISVLVDYSDGELFLGHASRLSRPGQHMPSRAGDLVDGYTATRGRAPFLNRPPGVRQSVSVSAGSEPD
jgi:hypothetical protein